MKTIVIGVFYLVASMTCTLNMLQECCASDFQKHQHEPSQDRSQGDRHNSVPESNNSHKHNSTDSELCCGSLITTVPAGLNISFQLFLGEFSEIPTLFSLQNNQIAYWIHLKDPPHSIRGNPLYKTLFSINAPPSVS